MCQKQCESGTRISAHKRYLKILLIEDNKELADVFSNLLITMGHQAAVVHNGAEGIKAAKLMRPDVIFCDIDLPGMSGYEVAKALRSDEETKTAYLIALTGYVSEYKAGLAVESGFDDLLTKPVDMKKLEKMLAETDRF